MSQINGTEISPLSRRNFVLGVINGASQQFGQSLVDTQTVLAVFVLDLMRGGGHAIIWLGLLNSLMAAGWYWPSALLASRMRTAERLQPYYNLSAYLRMFTRYLLWGAVALIGGGNPVLLFALITVLSFAYSSTGGLGQIPFFSVVTETIPANWRGKFFATRLILGNLLAFAAGLYIRQLLTAEGPQLWANYAHLFLLSAIFVTVGLGAWCFVREPAQAPQKRRLSLWQQLQLGPRLYRRDRNFRRLIRQRVLSSVVASFTFPFVTLFALSQHLATKQAVGLFLAASMVGLTVSNLLWGHISDRRGNRLLLIITTSLAAILPLLILLTRSLPAQPLAWGGSIAPDLRTAYLLVMFMLVGACQTGMDVGQTNYLLEVAPSWRRATYLGFYFAILVPVSFAPFVGALIIGAANRFTLGFALSAATALAALINAVNLEEIRFEGE